MRKMYHVVLTATNRYVFGIHLSDLFYWEISCLVIGEKMYDQLPLDSCQVLKLERIDAVNSPECGDLGENSVHPSNGLGTQISSRKKSYAQSARRRVKISQSESASSNAKNVSESSDSEIGPQQDATSPSKSKLAGKVGSCHRNSKRVAERVLSCMRKRQKKTVASDSDSIASGGLLAGDMKLRSTSRKENEDASSSSHKNVRSPIVGRSRRKECIIQDSNNSVQGEGHDGPASEMITDPPASSSDDTLRKEECIDENVCKKELIDNRSWKPFEKSLFEKGMEIFGRNRSVGAYCTCSFIFIFPFFVDFFYVLGLGWLSICMMSDMISYVLSSLI